MRSASPVDYLHDRKRLSFSAAVKFLNDNGNFPMTSSQLRELVAEGRLVPALDIPRYPVFYRGTLREYCTDTIPRG